MAEISSVLVVSLGPCSCADWRELPEAIGAVPISLHCSGVPVNDMMCRKSDVFLDPGTYFWVAKNCIVTVARRAFKGVATFFFF